MHNLKSKALWVIAGIIYVTLAIAYPLMMFLMIIGISILVFTFNIWIKFHEHKD